MLPLPAYFVLPPLPVTCVCLPPVAVGAFVFAGTERSAMSRAASGGPIPRGAGGGGDVGTIDALSDDG